MPPVYGASFQRVSDSAQLSNSTPTQHWWSFMMRFGVLSSERYDFTFRICHFLANMTSSQDDPRVPDDDELIQRVFEKFDVARDDGE